METLTVQAFLNAEWQDIALIKFPGSEQGDWFTTQIDYLTDYAIDFLERDDYHAVSLNHPVSLYFEDHGNPGWLRFIDDIIPSGASRRYWVNFLDISELPQGQQNFILLKFGTMSPVGNLRIKDSVPDWDSLASSKTFSVTDVMNRASDFLDYAQERGAAAGGATGAGGEAPKLLLRCSKRQEIWIDTWQNEPGSDDLYYLVKYPRGSRSEVDCNILRAEFHYYHELTTMGFSTIPVDNMRLEEGLHYPSLWLPRFDIRRDGDGRIMRLGMESVYSLLQKAPATILDHETTLRILIEKITSSHMVRVQNYRFDVQGFIIDWVRRDLLNIIFGNSDNHGRNTAFMKADNEITLAPIYDFAPMKADPEGIPRTMKWSLACESGGEYNFGAIAQALAEWIAPDTLLNALRETASQLIDLPSRLKARGVPVQILEMPSIGFKFIPDKLARWGLL
ncbi:HipA domain-containing protein [Klebsiella quasipneumoniae subsp. similipneumoniae]|uniref:type II toxin-antitoxin system HipA family toxin n=1 Tax=Klebsiella quasipneumoniae TaxID=1463165 RepID=UPI000D6EF132|nr:HipA domain-containing protein [Klebsiella quasipneumoniae]EKU6351203.1 type II toxin-antitoxin system HipA family toxin [Klebsiella quasipneumoniae]MBE8768044.1 type II toxin-antitoxin system HipA family toxin [Klebsiella quasipneumoniae]MCB3000982.1 type II toxin-antitoxin system HipA family toxin [Klebsiella quasipneumoniae]UAW27904.1 type II toxin-antitoxin system HipA family toxin [Klebsiella quasipneumoniae]WHL05063.1 HipA domain-containing protein [Klebsiella quasipneumoniae]